MGADGVGAYIFEHAQRHTARPGHLLRPFESGDFHRKGAARRQRAEDGKRLTRGRLTFDPLAVGIEGQANCRYQSARPIPRLESHQCRCWH